MFGVQHAFSLSVFYKSVGIGFLIGAIYALFMLLRALGPNGKFAVFFQDVAFFLIAAVLCFILLFDVNSGIGRFYIFIGVFCGGALFYVLPAKSAVLRVKRAVQPLHERRSIQKTDKKHFKKIMTRFIKKQLQSARKLLYNNKKLKGRSQ